MEELAEAAPMLDATIMARIDAVTRLIVVPAVASLRRARFMLC